MLRYISILIPIFLLFVSCENDMTNEGGTDTNSDNNTMAIVSTFGNNIDLDDLENYSSQEIPNYINQDNTRGNSITDAGATLGRVLFYDKNLSSDNSISCSSCHKQEIAFGDDVRASMGVNGETGRHSMRLVNARFAEEEQFFWDERAANLEEQTTMPIQDHAEMGFSGTNGDPDFNDLIQKLEAIDYYQDLFTFVYGDANITEQRMQNALAQFIRSIQSFDSKFDAGRSMANNDGQPFSNFTAEENAGKNLFLAPPIVNNQGIRVDGGAGCGGCHRPPEFAIDPQSRNNGFVGVLNNPGETDFTITRSPTLRDLFHTNGTANGQFMHSAVGTDIMLVINHYNALPPGSDNNNLDNRLRPNGNLQRLQLTDEEKNSLVAFLHTLSGNNVYTDTKWSDPF